MIRVSPQLISLLTKGSDKKKGLEGHFLNAVFVACSKRFEDDLKCKISELVSKGIHGEHCLFRGKHSKGVCYIGKVI